MQFPTHFHGRQVPTSSHSLEEFCEGLVTWEAASTVLQHLLNMHLQERRAIFSAFWEANQHNLGDHRSRRDAKAAIHRMAAAREHDDDSSDDERVQEVQEAPLDAVTATSTSSLAGSRPAPQSASASLAALSQAFIEELRADRKQHHQESQDIIKELRGLKSMASNVNHLARVMTETQMQGGRGAGRTRAQTISLMTDVVLLNQLGDALTQRVRSLSTQGRGPAAPSRTGFQRPRERSMIHEKFSKIPWTDLPEEDRKQITQRSTTSSEQGITSDRDPRYWNFNSFKSPVCLCCGSTFHIVGYCPTLFVRTRKG